MQKSLVRKDLVALILQIGRAELQETGDYHHYKCPGVWYY